MSFAWYGEAIFRAMHANLGTLLGRCGLDLQGESVDEAPKETGALRGNCAVDVSPDGMEVRVGYALPYARRQHEELSYHHDDGKAKYLEDPYNRKKGAYLKYIAKGVLPK